MDIQINLGQRVVGYLAKYMSKLDTRVDLKWGMQSSKEHFQARQVGAVETAMFITGWSGNRSSRGTVFLSLVLPGKDERRQLKNNIKRLPPNSTDIFTPTHVEKYLASHSQLSELTFTEYFTTYRLTETQDEDDVFNEPGEEFFGQRVSTIDQDEPSFFCRPLRKIIPISCTDGYYSRYQARTSHMLPFWRTHLY